MFGVLSNNLLTPVLSVSSVRGYLIVVGSSLQQPREFRFWISLTVGDTSATLSTGNSQQQHFLIVVVRSSLRRPCIPLISRIIAFSYETSKYYTHPWFPDVHHGYALPGAHPHWRQSQLPRLDR